MHKKKIKQIVTANGDWVAVHRQEDGSLDYSAFPLFALIEDNENGDYVDIVMFDGKLSHLALDDVQNCIGVIHKDAIPK